jgi:hypothetical protein
MLGVMDSARIRRMIEMADRHIREGEEHIALGKRIIADLSILGSDLGPATAVLASFLDSQRLHVLHRDRLLRELKLSLGPSE